MGTNFTLVFNKINDNVIATLSFYIILTIILFLPKYSFAENTLNASVWTTWKESQQIKIDYKKVEASKLIEIKAKATIKSSLSGFLSFIQDTQQINQWLDNAYSSKVLEAATPQDNVFITHFNSYWPITERYMLVKSRYWQNSDLSLEIEVNDINDERYLETDKIKIEVIKAHWRIQPNIDNTITIEYNVIADPKGAIPVWLTKRVSLRALWKTMNNLQEQLPQSSWQSHSIENIKEFH